MWAIKKVFSIKVFCTKWKECNSMTSSAEILPYRHQGQIKKNQLTSFYVNDTIEVKKFLPTSLCEFTTIPLTL